MQISSRIAGDSLGEADLLRRAMGEEPRGRWQRRRYSSRAPRNRASTRKRPKIFDLMAKFAEYGFNKSHSAAYALISYQTAFLKAHYPVEYMAALLTSEVQDTDKVVKYIHEVRQMGINILPPDTNKSMWDFTVVEAHDRDTIEPGSTIGSIRFGLAAVKNVGISAIEAIIERESPKSLSPPLWTSAKRWTKYSAHRLHLRRQEERLRLEELSSRGRATAGASRGNFLTHEHKHQIRHQRLARINCQGFHLRQCSGRHQSDC